MWKKLDRTDELSKSSSSFLVQFRQSLDGLINTIIIRNISTL
jgi:hypothetical protein